MISIADEGDVRVTTLDRPDRRNALTPEGLDALEEAVLNCPSPVLYLRGAGEAFCAGADLSTVAEVAETGDVEPFIRRGQRVANAIEDTPAIVVAGIDGAARGGGIELALACDLRLATPEATFGEPGVTLGIFGAWGGTVRLPEVVGMGDALDFSLSGRVIDSEEALRMGLVSRVLEEPRTVADRIANNDRTSLEFVKERIRDRGHKAAQEEAELEAFKALVETHTEALQKFGE